IVHAPQAAKQAGENNQPGVDRAFDGGACDIHGPASQNPSNGVTGMSSCNSCTPALTICSLPARPATMASPCSVTPSTLTGRATTADFSGWYTHTRKLPSALLSSADCGIS